MSKTLVYPFDRRALGYFRYPKLFPFNFDEVVLSAPEGWGFKNRDAGTIDYGASINVLVGGSLKENLPICDKVLFTDYDHDYDAEKIFKAMEEAIKAGKEVCCLISLSRQEVEKLESLAKKSGQNFRYIPNTFDYDEATEETLYGIESELRDIHVPVVMVFGLFDSLNKFEVQLGLTEFFKNQGYKGSLVASRPYASFFGFKAVPPIFLDRRFSDVQKVVLFNHFLKNIEQSENPDVIVVGVPGGILPFNNSHPNGFGVTAYLMTRSVTPDASIVCLHAERFSDSYLSNVDNIFRYRYASDNNAYMVSNVHIDLDAQGTPGQVERMLVSPEIVTRKLEVTPAKYPVFTKMQINSLFEHIENKLAQNADLQAI